MSTPHAGAARDLLTVLGVSTLFFIFSGWQDLSEKLADWTRNHEPWQADELPLTLLLLALGLAWFGWRRWREQCAEIGARQEAEARNADLLERNRHLVRRLIGLQEEEWRQIARELHDELGQYCTAIKVEAHSICRDTRDVMPSAHDCATAIVDAADHVHGTVRAMLRRLRPEALDDLGLKCCLQNLVEAWERRCGVACTLHMEEGLPALPESVNVALYRVVQECLTNIARHSGARHAWIMLRACQEGMELEVKDDGKGLGNDAVGLGLLGMAERIAALDGRLAIESRDGVRIRALFPLVRP